MKKLSKYAQYRPMIVAGAVSGLAFCMLAGVVLYVSQNKSEVTELDFSTAILQPEITLAEELKEPAPVELLFGGREVLPNHTFIALYGNPEYKSLGALGEQPLPETYARIKTLAAEYQPLTKNKVTPTLELITTIASAGPTENNDYSQEIDIAKIEAWVDDMVANGIYVVIDLQPGRNTFLQQAQAYESILKKPNVGLALDPEWRLQTERDRHLVKVGSVTTDEVNQTSEWLADLVKTHDLPQKIFIIHQFKLSMIQNRETLKTDREELAYVIHMDGHGSFGQKIETWNTIQANLPANTYLAWKNFYDEDKPTPTPQQTMQQIPQPVFVSYQ